MIIKTPITKLLFLDIETVAQQQYHQELSTKSKILWEQKTAYQRKEEDTPESFYRKAGIWAEFGKIICISVGYFNPNADYREFRVTSFYGEEKEILTDFQKLLNTHFKTKDYLLCAHNGKEFDFPFIARRMIIHGISLPDKLHLFGKKPWEIPHIDTLELWKFGDFKHYTSLELLTHILQIPSPKEDITADQVYDVYYQEKNIERICSYCQRDVIAIAQVMLRFQQKPILQEREISYIPKKSAIPTN